MTTLKILFQGICTHFLNVVPDVPHRVVLPDASPFRFGMISLLDEPQAQDIFYFLMPHFAFLRTYPTLPEALDVYGVMKDGNMYGGASLSVANASGDRLEYGNFFDEVPQITGFYPAYEWSHDVVIGRNAVCYLDLHSGHLEKFTEPNAAVGVVATVQTDGPPQLLVQPFSGAASTTIPLAVDHSGTAYLLVGNNGVDCDRPEAEQNFDFLLHYLTAKTGIPSELTQRTPGMPLSTLRSFTRDELQIALPKMERLQFPERYDSRCFGELTVDDFALASIAAEAATGRSPSPIPFIMLDTSPACSDTRYP